MSACEQIAAIDIHPSFKHRFVYEMLNAMLLSLSMPTAFAQQQLNFGKSMHSLCPANAVSRPLSGLNHRMPISA